MPVVGKTAAEISTRAAYFQNMIELQCRSSAMRDLGMLYHPKVSDVLAHIYFGLSEAYKSEFLYPEKRTDPTKQAALTCAAICAVKPLRPPYSKVDREEFIYANQMLAMRCSCNIVEHPFYLQHFDAQRRFYKQLELVNLPSAEAAIEEAAKNNGIIASTISLSLGNDEKYKIKSLINMFVVLRDLKIVKSLSAGETAT